jgi:hypothetical protein
MEIHYESAAVFAFEPSSSSPFQSRTAVQLPARATSTGSGPRPAAPVARPVQTKSGVVQRAVDGLAHQRLTPPHITEVELMAGAGRWREEVSCSAPLAGQSVAPAPTRRHSARSGDWGRGHCCSRSRQQAEDHRDERECNAERRDWDRPTPTYIDRRGGHSTPKADQRRECQL